MRILVLGANGMLGHVVCRVMSEKPQYIVTGTVRDRMAPNALASGAVRIMPGVTVEDPDAIRRVFEAVQPEAVVNCIGLVKQLAAAADPLQVIPINALLPHRLAALCQSAGVRLVHISTDCVFSGHKGNYTEADVPDPVDLYGRSKLLGEVDYPHTITLRTSIIGPELGGQRGIVGWFLSQQTPVKGFRRAIFSGLPTVELANLICSVVLPRHHLHGLFHVASSPISKFDLLGLISAAYGKTNQIIPDDELIVDRSLCGQRFAEASGYVSPPWPDLVRKMREFG
jgi:dTDP-4-dehydrorhamnose reductase